MGRTTQKLGAARRVGVSEEYELRVNRRLAWRVPEDAWARTVISLPALSEPEDLLEELVLRAELGHREAGHSAAVAGLAERLALELEPGLADTAYRAGLLHDIGKALLPFHPGYIPRGLDGVERGIVRRHPVLGAEMAAWAGERYDVVEAIRSHHERLDGQGYPDGKRGAQVTLVSQIVAAADVLEALASARSYKVAWQADSIRGYFDANRHGWVTHPVWEAAAATIDDVARSRSVRSALDAEPRLVQQAE